MYVVSAEVCRVDAPLPKVVFIADSTSTSPAAAETWRACEDVTAWLRSCLHSCLNGSLFTSCDAHATAQERSSRPKGKQASDKQGRSLDLVWSSIDELPCLPEFELWLQQEPGKGERHRGKAADNEQAISAYEQSSGMDVSIASSPLSAVCSCS